MPTVLRWNGYRFHFFSNEEGEPPHIHVHKAGCEAKFWIPQGILAYNDGFTHNELRTILEGISEHRDLLLEAWNRYHGY